MNRLPVGLGIALGVVILIIFIILIIMIVRRSSSNSNNSEKFSSLTGNTSNGSIVLNFSSSTSESGNYLLLNERTDTVYSGTYTADRTNKNKDFAGRYTLNAPEYLSVSNQQKQRVINLTGTIAIIDVRYQNDRYTAVPSDVRNDLFGIRDDERIILIAS